MVFHFVLRVGIGKHVTTYHYVVWSRSCVKKRKELSKKENDQWFYQVFDLHEKTKEVNKNKI